MPGSSRIHGVTNLVSIADVVSDDLIGLIRGEPLNPRFALPFLHEASHHACFTSAVGSAIAHLQLELWREVMESETLDAARVTSQAARVTYARELLRPLQEGIACFREFDAWTGPNSKSIGVELAWTLVLAGQPKLVAEFGGDRLKLLHDILLGVRLSENGVDRKANLLLQPVDRSGGGHLPGYVFLKAAWLVAAASVPSIIDESDLFCSWAKTFFFGDHVLGELILDHADHDLEDWSLRLLDYLNGRINVFGDTDADQIAAFDAWSSSMPRPENPPAELIGVDPTAQQVAISRFEEIDDRLKAELRTAGLRSFLAHMSASRHLFRIGSVPVRLETLDDGHIRMIENLDGEEIEFMRLKPEGTAPPSNANVEGRAEIIFDTHNSGLPTLVLVVSAEREVVALRPLRGSADPEGTISSVGAKHVDREMIEGLEALVIERLSKFDQLDEYLSEVAASARDAGDLLYLQTAAAAFAREAPDADRHPKDLLERFGGVDGLRGWALFGIAASATSRPAAVPKIFAGHHLDYEQVLARAQPDPDKRFLLGSIVVVDRRSERLQALP